MNSVGSLTLDVHKQLHEDLVAGRIPAGYRLKTVNLAKQFDVSLSAVREALTKLSAEGLVVAHPQRGFRAASISAEELKQVADAVMIIDVACLRRSIAAGDKNWEDEVRRSFSDFAETSSKVHAAEASHSERYRATYSAFRSALVSACDNQVLLEMRRNILVRSERHEHICAALGALRPRVAAEYEAVVEAALARDTARAVRLMKTRYSRNTARFLAAFESSEPSDIAAAENARADQKYR